MAIGRLKAETYINGVRQNQGFATGYPIRLATYTVATAPTATAGALIYVSNGAAGSPVVAFGNGTNWLRVDTLAAISAT